MSVMSKKIAESIFESPPEESVLWQEWSDAALNKESWSTPKNGPDDLFLDTQIVRLPSSLEPCEWIRAKDLTDLAGPLTVYVDESDYPDLITNNKHLLHSQFARWFISALINLQHCGRNGLEISGEHGNFAWNGRQQSWRGWMNVYSMNKAGKGVQHRPVVNLNGKYIVRLYFLGAWRQILVDDMIPVNAEKVPLLPRTTNNFELWSMILSKAILKLCALTWSEYNEIVDFHPVTCLTGWVCLRLDIAYLSPQDKWDFLRKYADHFEWEVEISEQDSQVASRSKKSRDGKSSTMRTKKSKGTERTKKSKATSDRRTDQLKLKPLTKPEPVTLFIGLKEMEKVSSDIMSDLAPCPSHFIYVVQSRDIPLDPKDVKPPLARWKLFRWLKWAIGEGIIDPVEYFVPIRSLKVVSPLKRCEESIINKYNNNAKENVQSNTTDKQTDVGTLRSKYRKRETDEKTREQMEDEPSPLRDISFWADFNKMEPFIEDVHFFYKLDYFQYTVRLSDRFTMKQSYDQRSEKKGSRRSSPNRVLKDSSFVDTYAWPHKMKIARNEPLYMFVDSLEEKFFLIDFSTFQVSVETFEESYDQKGITFSKMILDGNADSLIVERHSFFRRPEKSSCLASMMTAGTKSTVVEINRGRHLLRLHCYSESDCHITISSDTIFHVGDRKRMYQLMCTESETVDAIARHVSNSVSSAYQTFGTEKYLDGLRVYYDSYLPPAAERTWENKQFYDQIHDYFLEEKVQLIRRIVPENEFSNIARSLRIFFLNPSIGIEKSNTISTLIESLREMNAEKYGASFSYLRQDSTDKASVEKQKAASVIQSFFKMIIIRKYFQIHDPTHKQHEQVLRNLLKIAEMFNYNKRESVANQILRNMLKHHDKMYEIYHCSKDFEYTLQEQELKGTLTNVKPNQWLPVARFMVNAQATETVRANVDLFIDIDRYCVRAFNNETGQEMVRAINNVVTNRYAYTNLGYTIFCYCWSNERTLKELPWTLSITTIKGQPTFRFLANGEWVPMITAPPLLIIQELSNSYIPNSKNFISKWIVRATKPSIVSFRLRVSYDKVRMKLRVTDAKGRVLSQIKGTYIVILPMVYIGVERESRSMELLKPGISHENKESSIYSGEMVKGEAESKNDLGKEKNESKTTIEEDKVYHVEAMVLDDSWPLTREEWCLVSEFKIKPTGSVTKTKLPSCVSAGRVSRAESVRSRKTSRQTVDNTSTLESPYWILQVVTDSESGLEISQDRTKEKEIARMKEEWAKENPDSLERGRELREAFIKKHEVRPEISAGSFQRKSSSHSVRSVTQRDSQPPSLIGDTSELSMASHSEDRTLKPPSALRRLPTLDVSLYEIKEDEEDEPWVKTDADEEMLRNIRMMNVIYAQEDYTNFLDELDNLMKKQQEQYESLYGAYDESFWSRRAMLEDAYEARNSYVRSMKPPAPPSTKSTQTKTSKTTRNTRKSKKSKKT